MREYELMFVIHPDLDESALTDVLNRITGWITDNDGEIVKSDIWGKRTLAYPIRKLTEGQYVLLHSRMKPQTGAVLERNLRYLEPVLRYMIIAK